MASKKLKGITIEIDGNTTGLSDSLKDVNKNLYSVQSELKQVDNLLKFDPGNAELAAQKQALLSDAIEQTTEKLKTLRTAKEQADAKLASGDMSQKQYRELEREIIATENSLKQLNGTSQTYRIQQINWKKMWLICLLQCLLLIRLQIRLVVCLKLLQHQLEL